LIAAISVNNNFFYVSLKSNNSLFLLSNHAPQNNENKFPLAMHLREKYIKVMGRRIIHYESHSKL
jgi:DNA/RNA endonuclease G (NUC1)